MANDSAQSIISSAMRKDQTNAEEQRQILLTNQKERARSSRRNQTDEQRQILLEKQKNRSQSRWAIETEEQRQKRLEKKREQTRSSRTNETEEQRQIRLQKKLERTRSSRTNETEEQRQIRLEKKRERTRSSRINETEKQRQIRLEKKRERTRSSRINETEEQHQIQLEQQRKRSQTNRAKQKLGKQTHENIDTEQENTEMRFSIRPSWPEPIPRDLKETCLQQFLEQMSMSILAETTCAVCNIRTPAKDSKKLLISKIPNIHLLKVSEELKDLIINIQSPSLQHSRRDTEISANNNNIIKITEHANSNI
jgi:hypothetical protein